MQDFFFEGEPRDAPLRESHQQVQMQSVPRHLPQPQVRAEVDQNLLDCLAGLRDGGIDEERCPDFLS
jgi:hypothetical protein